jgi:MerR family transcriptional regulator/heat shock protein HspR
MSAQEADQTPERARGVYGIAVTAELVGTGVQNLRLYERKGLLQPARSDGGTRRYSQDDIDRLLRITALLADGLNLVGIAMVLELQDDNARLRAEADAK